MKPWMITWRGHTWTDADAKVGHISALKSLGFGGWDALSPWSSPELLAAWVAVLMASTLEDSLDACVMLVAKAPLGELTDCLDDREPASGDAD